MGNFTTWLYTLLKGVYIGSDEFGNKYYQSKLADRVFDRRSRWVVYRGLAEPTKVPPQWYGWLHYQTDEIPLSNNKRYTWEEQHMPNMTGTKYAYYPKGHVQAGACRDKATGDYQPWRPE